MAKRSSGMPKEDLRALADEIQGEILDRNLRDAEKGMVPMGDGSPRDPVLEEKMRRYFHAQRTDLVRRFLLHLYDDALGDSVDLLHDYSGADLCGYGCHLANTGHHDRAYGVLSLALLKGEESARDLLEGVAAEIRRHRSLQRVDTLNYCKRYMDRIMHFVRRV